MKISVIGCGYLGAVHAAAMASLGHQVVGIDVDPAKVAALNSGVAPFFEPGLEELLAAGIASGKLRFSTHFADAASSTVHFIGVGTPQAAGSHAADLSFVHAAVQELLPHLKVGDLVVGKSTGPVGTAASLAGGIAAAGATLLWNPEFLREGFAVKDTLEPDRIVVGAGNPQFDHLAVELLKSVYFPMIDPQTPFLTTNFATAELVKVAANSFLATKISFINAMSEVAAATGADVTELADAIGLDDRIGRKFLGAGIGFGGGCLPKDIRAFTARAEELGLGDSVAFLREVDAINTRQRARVVRLACEALEGDVAGKRITILGATFKPNSDDIRDSPALDVALQLHNLGAQVVVTDPKGLENTSRVFPQLQVEPDVLAALNGAELVILATEWQEYRSALSPVEAGRVVAARRIIDARNCLDAAPWRVAGWDYQGLGR